jgi:hypothetical protein
MVAQPSQAQSVCTPSLLDVLRERQQQAAIAGAPYLAPVPDSHGMLHWIGLAAGQARKAAERKTVHVGASADMDQSTVWRFEEGVAWPRKPEALVNAYADDLDVEPIELWEEALRLWRADLEASGENSKGEIRQRLEAADPPHEQQRGSRRAGSRDRPSAGRAS